MYRTRQRYFWLYPASQHQAAPPRSLYTLIHVKNFIALAQPNRTAILTIMSVPISPGEDADQVRFGIERLLANGWTINDDQALEKKYYFQKYAHVLVIIMALVINLFN